MPVSSCLPGRIYVKFRDLHQQPSGPNASNISNVSNETMMPEAGSSKKYLEHVLRKLFLVFYFCFFFWVSQDGSLGTLRQIMSCHINSLLAGGPRLLRCLGVLSYQQDAQALPANVLARYPYATGAAAHVLGLHVRLPPLPVDRKTASFTFVVQPVTASALRRRILLNVCQNLIKVAPSLCSFFCLHPLRGRWLVEHD